MRVRPIVLGAVASVAVLFPGVAHAGVTKVFWEGDLAQELDIKAAPGTENSISVEYEPYNDLYAVYIRDTAGIVPFKNNPLSSCYPNGPKLVFCPDGGSGPEYPGVRGLGLYLDFFLLDGDDLWIAALGFVGQETRVYGGRGDDLLIGHGDPYCVPEFEGEPGFCFHQPDELVGGRGNDKLSGDGGPDYLRGGPGKDRINSGLAGAKGDKDSASGGPGRDRIDTENNNRDIAVHCGPGRDRALIDTNDPRPIGCEVVIRR